MKIKAAVLSDSLVWKSLLTQLGVAFEYIADETSFSHFSVLIVDSNCTATVQSRMLDYIDSGGAVIDTGKNIERILGGKTSVKPVRALFPDSTLPFDYSELIDTMGTVLTFSKAKYLQKSCHLEKRGAGVVAFSGLQIKEALSDQRSCRKMFPSDSYYNPNEEVASVSKGTIERFFFALLKHLHVVRGIPFVHKWFFPEQYRNVLLFRIDSDFGTKENVKKWFELAEKYKLKFSWYLHTEAHRGWLGLFKENPNHELAVHGAEHIYARSYDIQKENVQKAVDELNENDIAPQGYASPYGLWDVNLNRVCDEFNFEYSTEFAWNYDGLPGYSLIDNEEKGPLQIPIHPICVGSLKTAKMNESEMRNYFEQQFQLKLSQNSPLVFYDHPNHEYIEMMVELLHRFNRDDVCNMTFLEYARWWKGRDTVQFSATYDDGFVAIESDSKEYSYAIWKDDTTFLLSGDTHLDLAAADFNVTSNTFKFSEKALRKSKRFSFRFHKLNFLINRIYRRSTVIK